MKVYVIKHRDNFSVRNEYEDQFSHCEADDVTGTILGELSRGITLNEKIDILSYKYPTSSHDQICEWLKELSAVLTGKKDLFENQIIYLDQSKWISPVHVIAEVTHDCNMNCHIVTATFGATKIVSSKCAACVKKQWYGSIEICLWRYVIYNPSGIL